MGYIFGFIRDSAIFVIVSLLILCVIHLCRLISKSERAKKYMRLFVVLFIALLVIVIFAEGIMIADQEARISQMKSRVDETITETDNLLNKLNTLIDEKLSATSTCEAVPAGE